MKARSVVTSSFRGPSRRSKVPWFQARFTLTASSSSRPAPNVRKARSRLAIMSGFIFADLFVGIARTHKRKRVGVVPRAQVERHHRHLPFDPEVVAGSVPVLRLEGSVGPDLTFVLSAVLGLRPLGDVNARSDQQPLNRTQRRADPELERQRDFVRVLYLLVRCLILPAVVVFNRIPACVRRCPEGIADFVRRSGPDRCPEPEHRRPDHSAQGDLVGRL